MKKINKSIISFVTLIALGVNTWFAAWFPSEPMVIYGNINGTNIENKTLNITDWNNTILQSVNILNEKYGTNKTFDLENKIILNQFEWNLQFKVDDTILNISDGLTNSCNGDITFQKAKICEYNLSSVDTLDDMDNIPEEDKSEEFDDIFSGKIVEVTKEEIEQEIWSNIVSTIVATDEIVVVNKAVDVDNSVTKDLVIISDTKKEVVFIPKDTNTWNSDLVIEKPEKITSISTIKSKINKDVFGAIEIRTNNQVNFDKYIRVCLTTSINSVSGLKVYASHDNNSWFFDTSAKNLKIENTQICFDVNHLTSFAVAKDISNSSSGGGSGWGGGYSTCKADELVCTKVWSKYYYRAENGNKCKLKSTKEICSIDEDKTIETKEISKNTDSIEKKVDTKKTVTSKYNNKLTSKAFITWVRSFIKNKKEIKQVWNLRVVYVKWDEDYNKKVNALLKKINKDMKVTSIKQDMVRYIDTMSTSYGVMNDETVSDELRAIFKTKLAQDIERVEKKLIVLKRKDFVVNRVLNKRKLEKSNNTQVQTVYSKKVTEESTSNNVNYTIATYSLNLKSDIEFKNNNALLAFWDRLTLIKDYGTFIKAKVVSSQNWVNGTIWFVSKKYLRKSK